MKLEAPLTGIRFRVATADDHNAIAALLAQADLPDEIGDAAQFLLAELGPALVGTVATERYGAAALLRSLAVVPAQRGRGLGAALVERTERDAREQGIADLYLLTTTAEKFFAARGYVRIDRGVVPS